MKTIQDEARNLTIEEITKLEADTVGRSFFSKDSVLPFRDDESETKYQNLLYGNDRTVNRELYVHFERCLRDIMEYVVKQIIPRGQSVFMAQQTDKGIKEFFENNNRNYPYPVLDERSTPDYKAESTDWITYFSCFDYAELPESLCEDRFIEGIYDIFSYEVLPLRLQYHKEGEGANELAKLAEEVQQLIRIRTIDVFRYVNHINEFMHNPSDLDTLKKDFTHDVFDSFEDFCDAVHYLFDFYSHLCQRIGEYKKTRTEKSKAEKWGSVFRSCAYHKSSSYNDLNSYQRNEQFWEALEDLHLSESFKILKNEFEGVSRQDDKFFNAYIKSGARGLIQAPHLNGGDFNLFIVPFINGIIEIANSLSACTQKGQPISSIDDIEVALEAISPKLYYSYTTSFESEKAKIPLIVDEEKLSESEKIVYRAIKSIAAQLLSGSKNYSEKLNTRQWFDFMGSLVRDPTFCMKEEQKTKNFIRFQNEMVKRSSSAFNDFIAQLTCVFEYQGFLSSIDMCLENLESVKFSDDADYEYSYYKTSFDFIEKVFREIREKACEFIQVEKEKNVSPYWKHSTWIHFLEGLNDESFSVAKLPDHIDDWYFDSESFESKQKYDGKTSFKPLNIWDFMKVLQSCVSDVPETIITIIYDLFRLKNSYSYYKSNTVLDKYEYAGLLEQNPFAHSTVAMFYKFLYGIFLRLRTNIIEFSPQGLSQKKILEYSLMTYIASYIVNSRSEYSSDKKDKSEEIRRFTLAKHFAKRYFDKKGGEYKPSMKCANSALKDAVKAAGLKIGESLSDLATKIDTKQKSTNLKDTPASSVYVFNCIISDDSLFPKEISAAVVKKYRTDYFNYYLLCNFIKAVRPYFGERTEKIVCDIVEGILEYTFYNPTGYKTKTIKNGFDYLLRKDHKNRWYGQGLFYDYFWYNEQKDDRLLKTLRRNNSSILSECTERMKRFSDYDYYRRFVDVELEAKYAEYYRDEGGDGLGDFCYNYFRAELEYFKFRQDQKTASLKVSVEYYEEAFKFIYHAGSLTLGFVDGILKILEPIKAGKQIVERHKEQLKQLEKYNHPRSKNSIEQYYKNHLELANKRFGFDVSSPGIRNISLIKLKRIWQWVTAAGISDRAYEQIHARLQYGSRGDFFLYSRFCHGDRPKALENLEKLVADLEQEE